VNGGCAAALRPAKLARRPDVVPIVGVAMRYSIPNKRAL
jgi:hypothetical protein